MEHKHKHKHKLTHRQHQFVLAYLQNGGNATAAAQTAGFGGPSTAGSLLLKKPHVAAAIQETVDAQIITAREVLGRLAEQARGSIEPFIDLNVEVEVVEKDGTVRTVRRPWVVNLEKAQAAGLLHLVRKLSYDRRGYPTLELYDAQVALTLLGKHLRLFVERVEHRGNPEWNEFAGWTDAELEEYARTGRRPGVTASE